MKPVALVRSGIHCAAQKAKLEAAGYLVVIGRPEDVKLMAPRTRRDYFIAAAFQGLLANPKIDVEHVSFDIYAQMARDAADDLLEVLAEPGPAAPAPNVESKPRPDPACACQGAGCHQCLGGSHAG